jgi:monoamine oxidase
MARKRSPGRKEPKLADQKARKVGLNRRDFFSAGAAAGAAVLSVPSKAQESSFGARDARWDYEADVVVLGSGCVGLHAAVRARDVGASVLVIEQNFDVGGKLVHSGCWTSLGGGDSIQEREAPVRIPMALD